MELCQAMFKNIQLLQLEHFLAYDLRCLIWPPLSQMLIWVFLKMLLQTFLISSFSIPIYKSIIRFFSSSRVSQQQGYTFDMTWPHKEKSRGLSYTYFQDNYLNFNQQMVLQPPELSSVEKVIRQERGERASSTQELVVLSGGLLGM